MARGNFLKANGGYVKFVPLFGLLEGILNDIVGSSKHVLANNAWRVFEKLDLELPLDQEEHG